MSLNHRNDQIVWPRRPNGMRRRASASQVLKKGRISRPASWALRLFALLVIAVPSLIVTSPGYVAFADKLPDPSQVTTVTSRYNIRRWYDSHRARINLPAKSRTRLSGLPMQAATEGWNRSMDK